MYVPRCLRAARADLESGAEHIPYSDARVALRLTSTAECHLFGRHHVLLEQETRTPTQQSPAALWTCFFFSDGLDTPLCGQQCAFHRKWQHGERMRQHSDVGSITSAPFGARSVTSAAPWKRALGLRGGSAERAPFVDICCRPQLWARRSASLGGLLAGLLLQRGLRDTSVHNHVGSTVRQANS